MEKENPNVIANVEIEIKRFEKGELIDAIAAGAKLTKADAGKAAPIKETITATTTLDARKKRCKEEEDGCGCGDRMVITYDAEYEPQS